MTDVTESVPEVARPPAPEHGITGPGSPEQGSAPVSGTILPKFADPLRIPPLLRPMPGPDADTLTVKLRKAEVKLHSALPPTPMWTYAGSFPGPTIEVRRGQRLRVNWANRLDGPYPVVAVEVDRPPVGGLDGPFPQVGNLPGRDGAQPRPEIADLPPWAVTHLHGARTNAANDGLPENAVLPGDSQLAEYPNDQQAATLWYHDHAMDMTRYTVISGLLGMYLIRDDEENKLRLPSGDYEVPLIICDRNLDTDAQGRLTGQLLHKSTALNISIPGRPVVRSVLQFFGPYTTVNGVIWPYFEVDARWYRFRMLNASNSRIYRLSLLDADNKPIPGAIKQIGTDSGLLPQPVSLDGELILAPAERADVLINFRAFRGQRLRMVTTGVGAANVNPVIVPGQTDPGNGLVEPDVLQFRVRDRTAYDGFALPEKLSPSFTRLTHDALPHDHEHRWIVIVPPNLTRLHPELWEMAEVDPATVRIPSEGVIQVRVADHEVVTLTRVAKNYDEELSFFVEHGSWEQWKFLNLGNATLAGQEHPIHIHLIKFQALSRDLVESSTFDSNLGGTTAPIAITGPGVLDPNEQGWKDTIRVRRGELVSVAGQFAGGKGRFVYHCHLLDHEDEGMMRPFTVRPAEVLKLSHHDGGDHHHG